ncbi:MAG: acetylornithine deacetylase [Saprospiraceae bacterium]
MSHHPQLPLCKKILTDLMAFDVLGGQSNLSIIDYIKEYLTKRNIAFQLVPHQTEPKTSLHCRIGPAVDGGLILSGHTDVVPVKGQEWHTDPFVAQEVDDQIYGRGSCDMKGFIACCLAMADTMIETHLKKPIYFAFSYDEEIGCLAGPELAAAILRDYTETPQFAIIGEPSMMQPVIGHKGICVLKTTVKGSAGHSSRIRQEVSAIHVAAHLIAWLERKMERMVELGRLDQRFHPPHSSIHVGMIHGGIAPNVIADICEFYWDIRVIPSDDVYDILNDFQLYCREYESQLKFRFPFTQIITTEDHPPVVPLGTDDDADIIPLIRSVSGNEKLGTVSYAAEAGQFSEAGFQTVICGPGDIAQAHRANEYVAVDQLNQCLYMLDRLVSEFG